MSRPRYREIADDLEASTRERTDGRLPSEQSLAARYGVSRGTVRQALALLRAEGVVTSRRGTRRVVLDAPRTQSFAELTSFTRWARAVGGVPSGVIVRRAWGGATEEEASRLRLAVGDRVLRVLRARSLDDVPIMVERTTFPAHAGAIVDRAPGDTVSLTETLEAGGVELADAEHVVDLAIADADDVAALGCGPGTALLRERRRTTDPAGKPVEWSDDRYLPGTVVFSVHNSRASGSLTRAQPERSSEAITGA